MYSKIENVKRTLLQFAKEFSIPFVCALAYVASVKYWPSTGYGTVVKDFGLGFFFVSWFSGNVVRIWRTDKTQTALSGIRDAISAYEEASSKAMKANSDLLQEIALAVKPNTPQTKDTLEPGIYEVARRSAEANVEMAAANTAAMSVILSTIRDPILRIQHHGSSEGEGSLIPLTRRSDDKKDG